MPSGKCNSIEELPPRLLELLTSAQRSILSTVDSGGRAHSVPVCHALRGGEIISAIDHKPKSTTRLARVKNIERTGEATLLADHYDDDWRKVGWVMIRGAARLEEIVDEPTELLDKYPQYKEIDVGEGLIVLTPSSILWWTYS
jgi:PPOX class probable F420-dependent enzyme